MITRHWPFFIFVAALLFAAVVQGYLFADPTGDPDSGESPNAGSVGQLQLVMPTSWHIPDGQAATYNTVPPTSGDHWAGWARCGFYEEGLPDELIVHNLEHSIIVISYNLTTEAEVNRLRSMVKSIGPYRTWGLSRYYDKIPPGTVALAAWGVLETMDRIDRDLIQSFFNDFAGEEGLERIPCEIDPSQIQF